MSEKEALKKIKEIKKSGKTDIIDLSGCKLKRVSKEITAELASATQLDLSFNEFKSFPDLSDLSNLRVLDLTGNKLVEINEPHVARLTKLEDLNLTGNQINTLSPEFFQLTTLVKLNLSNNKINNLTENFGKLVRLEDLLLLGNPLPSLPNSIGELRFLEVLDVFGCGLTTLPPDFVCLTRLIDLNLGVNRLSTLPKNIGNMTRLANLNIQDNQITDLPMSIGLCVGLSQLHHGINLIGNPIRDAEMVKKAKIGADHLFDYLEKRLVLRGDEDSAPKKTVTPTTSLTSESRSRTSTNGSSSSVGSPRAPSSPKLSSPVSSPRSVTTANLKYQAEQAVHTSIRPKLGQLQQGLSSTSLNDLLPVAKLVRSLQAEVEKAMDLVSSPVAPNPVAISKDDDKITALRKASSNALEISALTIRGLMMALNSAKSDAEISNIASVILHINKLLTAG